MPQWVGEVVLQASAELLFLCKGYDGENKASGLIVTVVPVIDQLVHEKVLIFTVHLRTSVFPPLHLNCGLCLIMGSAAKPLYICDCYGWIFTKKIETCIYFFIKSLYEKKLTQHLRTFFGNLAELHMKHLAPLPELQCAIKKKKKCIWSSHHIKYLFVVVRHLSTMLLDTVLYFVCFVYCFRR